MIIERRYLEMKRNLSQMLLFGLVLLGLIFFPSCGSSTKNNKTISKTTTEEGIKLKVGYLPISAALPLFVSLEHGLFNEQGISVEPVKYQNGALMAEDVITGRVSAACPGPADVYLVKEVESSGRFKIYLQTAYTPTNFIYSIMVRKDSSIKKLEDLRGKKIGVFPGVTNKLLLEILLQQKFGWTPDKDFRVQGISASLQLDALETGEYDAICPLEPMGTIGTFRTDLKMIDRGPIEKDVLNPLYITLHALSTKAMKENPEQLRKFVTAMEKAVSLIRDSEQANRALLPKYTSLTLEQARLTPIGECYKISEASRLDFQKLSDLLTNEGVLSRSVDVNTLYYKLK
jgi:NitT/TauT family transport system substrate-binding protein